MFSAWDAEKKRQFVLEELRKPKSHRNKVFILCNYFEEIISSGDELIINSFIPEFMDDLIRALRNYDPYYIPIKETEKIVEVIQSLKSHQCLRIFEEEIENILIGILADLHKLEQILKGKDFYHSKSKLLFPILEINGNGYALGMLDSLTIQISKANEQKFIIIPSEIEIEENLNQQIVDSWAAALKYCWNRKLRMSQNHKVIIQFDKRAGIYIGNSLGVVLTIGFIEQLLEYYNAPYLVSVNSRTAITGGMKSSGAVLPVGKSEIEKKTEIVFYSPANYFAVPGQDEPNAKYKLEELKKEYPDRNLRIIPIDYFEDVPDRRTIVDITKQKSVIRLAKSVKKNYLTVLLIAIIIILSGYYVIRDFNNNPEFLDLEEGVLIVSNIHGKLLWKKHTVFLQKQQRINQKRNFLRLFDINRDGINEVVTAIEFTQERKRESGIFRCFDNKGNEIWSYNFKDTISSPREILQSDYVTYIADIDSQKNILYCFANNYPSYAGALFKLDLKTGKRLPGTVWHTGHIVDGVFYDYNKDNLREIMFCGANNGYEDLFIAVLPENKFSGTNPSFRDYPFYNRRIADFLCYIKIGKDDATKFLGYRFPTLKFIDNHNSTEKIRFNIEIGNDVGNRYELSYNLKDISIVIADNFRLFRDSLVVNGELKEPYSDTKEYRSILLNNIRYWNGKEFVKREELE